MQNSTYMLDTNIIINNPYILNELINCEVIIPFVVLQELDNLKKEKDYIGYNAREFSRIIDALYYDNNYIKETNTSIFYTDSKGIEVKEMFGEETNDIKILQALYNCGKDVILLSNDSYMRSRARCMGFDALELTQDDTQYNNEDEFKGYIEVDLDGDLINYFYRNKFIELKYIDKIKSYPHMFIIFKNGSSQSAIGKVDASNMVVELLENIKDLRIFGIVPENVQQRMAFELLLDKDIPLVTIEGKAGSGKTILAIAASLMMIEQNMYNKILLSKADIPVGKDIGTLPGGVEEKLAPMMASYFDNLEVLFSKQNSEDLDNIIQMYNIQINPLSAIRGRSLPEQIIIIDEAQNITKKDMKTFITRVGKDSKIIVMGDRTQIDNPKLSALNNGLVYTMEKFKEYHVAGHITLQKGIRSDLASIAADIM